VATEVVNPSAGLESAAGAGAAAPSPSAGTPAASPPEAVKPDQELGQPGEATQQQAEAQEPWSRDPRFREQLDWIKRKGDVEKVLEIAPSAEDAQTLLESANAHQADLELRQADPVGWASQYARDNPEGWGQIARVTTTETLRNLARKFQAGGDENGVNAVEVLLQELTGGSAAGGPGSRPGAGNQAKQEQERLGNQQRDFFMQRVGEGTWKAVLDKVKPLTEKVAFLSPEQRSLFDATLQQRLDDALGRNQAFILRMQNLQSAAKAKGYADDQVQAVVQAHLDALRGGLLDTTVRSLLQLFGHQIAEAHEAKAAKEAKAAERREPAGGGGAPGGGAMTELQKDARLKALRAELGPVEGMKRYLEEVAVSR
jgi:hypothetical protein